MKQKSVYLHTDKDLERTNYLLKQQGMEIIFKSSSVDLHFRDLTNEEQASFIETNAEELKTLLKCFENGDKSVKDLVKKIKTHREDAAEFVKLLRAEPKSFKTSQKFETYNKSRKAFAKQVNVCSQVSFMRMRYFDYLPLSAVNCSILIAKKGTELVRYLSFKKDPVLTITGPKASKLKLSLESKF